MLVTIITPSGPLVTPANAKTWAPVLAGESDDRLGALLAAAQAGIEPPQGWTGCAFGPQTLEAAFDGFSICGRALPYPPLRSVVSVKYIDLDGSEQPFAAENYDVIGVGTRRGGVMLKTSRPWPATASRPDAVRIRFEAGYPADDPQLMPVKQAIVLAATHLRSLATRDLALSNRSVEGAGSRSWVVSDAAEKLIRNAVEGLLMPFKVYS